MKKGIRNLSLLLMFLLAGTFANAQDDATATAESDDKTKDGATSIYEQWHDPQRFRLPPAVNQLLTDEVSPAISRDGKTLIFQSNRGKTWKGYSLYMTTRDDNGKWTKPTALESINSKAGDSTVIAGPFLSYDGKSLFFSSNLEDTKGGMDLYVSTRESLDGEFGEPTNLGDVNTADYQGFPTVSADGNRLYYMQRAEGAENTEEGSEAGTEEAESKKSKKEKVWCYTAMVSSRSADDVWSTGVEVEGVMNEDCSKAFRIMADGETMFYTSMREGAKMQGHTKGIRADAKDFDLFMSRMEGESWGEPMAADFANHLSAEGYVSMAPDDGAHTVMYFDADMNASHEIFWTLVPPGFSPRKVMTARGNVEDSITGEPVYTIMKFENQTRPSLSYDRYDDKETGKFSTVITEGNVYKVSIEHEDYLPYTFMWDFTNAEEITNLYQRVRLVPKGVEVTVTLLDAIDEQPVDAKLTIKAADDTSIGEIEKTGTGKYEARLDPGQVYTLTGEATGNYMEEVDTLDLTQAQFGDKVNKILYMLDATKIKFDNINFRTARWDLNGEATAELDKVYQFLTDYPKMKIRIEAHTDYRGGDSYNQRLSQNRAKSALDYLVSKGIPATRLESEGYGEAQPTVPNEVDGRANQANMAINRRVEFKLVR
ncbi:outer membrane protein/peptidoglycan-associated (lipo)protein [Bernardetia litoralis DSM 6794]|uniref:Outer membrane protein/peptidoglycan-associated (Lipo)protein n=1 Tax=Bernardetia litoralis (strain ATCC 23117 / DSM 6794 / NBRC 15988 / NCIMB 1366 / Fx l1 / Sio-4) TaxID=880071 RepID=I4ALW0_BERLS|nr:OmpA family protein [Bernardetia litoralis]AFM04945.1 outer membrane protein/peptidoglycan-associated (lipo)protein [Bernardetia litoralis DSM 6794]